MKCLIITLMLSCNGETQRGSSPGQTSQAIASPGNLRCWPDARGFWPRDISLVLCHNRSCRHVSPDGSTCDQRTPSRLLDVGGLVPYVMNLPAWLSGLRGRCHIRLRTRYLNITTPSHWYIRAPHRLVWCPGLPWSGFGRRGNPWARVFYDIDQMLEGFDQGIFLLFSVTAGYVDIPDQVGAHAVTGLPPACSMCGDEQHFYCCMDCPEQLERDKILKIYTVDIH